MLALLKRMEPDKDNVERELHKDDFWASISKIANTKSFKQNPEDLLEHYIKRKIFQLGVKIKCDTCSHNSWYDIHTLNYKVQCPNCLEEFDIPSHSPDKIAWSYRTIGPFRLPKRAEGVYSTLLTLRVFSSLFHHSPITPMLSFEKQSLMEKIAKSTSVYFIAKTALERTRMPDLFWQNARQKVILRKRILIK